jgi:signal transduction histidine kinase
VIHGISTKRFFSEIQEPLTKAIKMLTPHSREITASWRGLIDLLARDRAEFEVLCSLDLEAQYKNLLSSKFDNYKCALEMHGKELALRGVPEEHAVVSLAFHLESCLPFVTGNGLPRRELISALARLTSAGQLFLMSGYSRQGPAVWPALDDRERRKLSRDLHDEVGHALIVLKLYLEMIGLDLKKGNKRQIGLKLKEATTLVAGAIDSVRRLTLDLGPAILEELGLIPALKFYVRQFSSRTGIDVNLEEKGLPTKLPARYEAALYRLLQGALSNVAEHSGAKKVKVFLGCTKDGLITLTVEDDGKGFDMSRQQRPRRGFGLTAMRERIELLEGEFHVESRFTGTGRKPSGTTIEVDLPLQGCQTT